MTPAKHAGARSAWAASHFFLWTRSGNPRALSAFWCALSFFGAFKGLSPGDSSPHLELIRSIPKPQPHTPTQVRSQTDQLRVRGRLFVPMRFLWGWLAEAAADRNHPPQQQAEGREQEAAAEQPWAGQRHRAPPRPVDAHPHTSPNHICIAVAAGVPLLAGGY
jgi:hypothetical protein